jgi:3-hydroxyanthranilate 3,4-dioxygenase
MLEETKQPAFYVQKKREVNILPPINLQKWLEDNKKYLVPPINNRLIFKENGFIVMAVGGPNERSDFHLNEGPEIFYQLKGDMELKIYQNREVSTLTIKEGELFLLPAGVPHSPQRFKDTLGLVVERSRTVDEKDGLLWFCAHCNHCLYERYFQLKNIEKDFHQVFQDFYSNLSARTCEKCGEVAKVPEKAVL